ncbi:hypothetical protein D9M72_582490 [compost metagenome]
MVAAYRKKKWVLSYLSDFKIIKIIGMSNKRHIKRTRAKAVQESSGQSFAHAQLQLWKSLGCCWQHLWQ